MKIKHFIKEVIGEMDHVKWPTRKMAIGSTWAVILISVAVGAYLGVLDLFFKKALSVLVNLF